MLEKRKLGEDRLTYKEEYGLKGKVAEEYIRMKKNLWIIPVIAAIFGIITFLVPVISFNFTSYYNMNWDYWIWGLTSYSLSDPDPYGLPDISEIAFTNNTTLLTVSIISSIMILIGVIGLLIAAITSKRHIQYSKKFLTITGLSAVLLIVGGIIFRVGAGWPTTERTGSAPPGIEVWTYFNEGFSIYTPFIAGGIALVGIITQYLLFKFRIDTSGKTGKFGFIFEEFSEKIDKIFILEKDINEKIIKLEETQSEILDQLADLRKTSQLENPPI